MNGRIRIREAVIVEGKYDKIRLSSLIDGLIITTDGFGIFKDAAKMDMLRKLAETRGLLVITDSDSAGFVIRNHLRSCIPPERVRHAYIPDVFGKERRKDAPSKEGKLGVEGMSTAVLLEALRKAGVVCEESASPQETAERAAITSTDFYRCGLSGGPNSALLRAELLLYLGLPSKMTAKALLGVINEYMTIDEFYAYFRQ
jgi:Small primase-like proteins (Toprim domain)